MTIEEQIAAYLDGLPEPKRGQMRGLHQRFQQLNPAARLWFLDGKNDAGATVSNPNIGYGCYTIAYADGTRREFYQVGLSANTAGISVYIMGLKDKTYLAQTYGATLGKASVTGYCIKFKTLNDIRQDVLEEAVRYGYGLAPR